MSPPKKKTSPTPPFRVVLTLSRHTERLFSSQDEFILLFHALFCIRHLHSGMDEEKGRICRHRKRFHRFFSRFTNPPSPLEPRQACTHICQMLLFFFPSHTIYCRYHLSLG